MHDAFGPRRTCFGRIREGEKVQRYAHNTYRDLCWGARAVSHHNAQFGRMGYLPSRWRPWVHRPWVRRRLSHSHTTRPHRIPPRLRSKPILTRLARARRPSPAFLLAFASPPAVGLSIRDHVGLVVVGGREAAHGRVAHGDVERLDEALEDGLLHVRHVVALADGLDERLRLLVREHR